MKSKFQVKILLPVVIVIWSIIGYQLYSSLKTDAAVLKEDIITTKFKPNNSTQLDTFSVSIFNRDPFLGTLINNKRTLSSKKAIKKNEPTLNIQYKGVVKNKTTKESIFVLNSNGEQFLLKKGQKVNNIKVISGNEKSLNIIYKNERIHLEKE